MFDLWWGLCERRPNEYDFQGYLDLMQQCQALGLKVQAVMSFHACGGNVGDSVNVPLPEWVLDLEDTVPELFYRDQRGDASREYVSLSCDRKAVFPRGKQKGAKLRTALEVYSEFMKAFRDESKQLIESGVLEEIQVGCGPCGELRYPSYPLTPREHFPAGWGWPGMGEVQCYDSGMLHALNTSLSRTAPPTNMGSYNDFPEEVAFWRAPPDRRKPRVPDGWYGLGGHTTAVGRALRYLHQRYFRPPKRANEIVHGGPRSLPGKIVFRVRSSLFPGSLAAEGAASDGGSSAGGNVSRELTGTGATGGGSAAGAATGEEVYWHGTGLAFLEWYREQVCAHARARVWCVTVCTGTPG